MLEVEIFGAGSCAVEGPSPGEVRKLCRAAADAAGVRDGHVAIEFVDASTIARLNREHRAHDEPTDVLSFPIDGAQPLHAGAAGARAPTDAQTQVERTRGEPRDGGVQRELGDVVICPEHTADLREAIVHGMLHLLGMDHETDGGEMLALQRALLAGVHA
jgi:probable rRNA maturation factor